MFAQLAKSLFIFILVFLVPIELLQAEQFVSNYPCKNQVKTCIAGAEERSIEGFPVYRECWQYGYQKTCEYPSKNDCRLYEHCYLVNFLECLLKDEFGNCVNQKKDFSCESTLVASKENKKARIEIEGKEGEEGLICTGIPCLDGNCVDKSYMTNGEMMNAISRLYAFSNMKPDKDHNFNLFPGFASHCSNKATSYSSCCNRDAKGWGKNLGAKCSADEVTLMNLRSKNLCIFVGKKKSRFVTKHYFCCFGSMLNKVVQVEGRKQLGLSFGSGDNPDCRGLTLDEIERLDFSQMDFSEFINELTIKFAGSYNAPNQQEIGAKIESHMNIKKYDAGSRDKENKLSGINNNIKSLDGAEYE